MFEKITDRMKELMAELEEMDARERKDGTSLLRRLRQIPPETGRFLAILAANSPEGEFVEIGTSGGYSAMWLSLACMERGIRLKTIEIMEGKIAVAKETLKKADLEEAVELFEGDALEIVQGFDDIAFCFLDAEKELYEQCYDLVIPKLVQGGLLVADNAISHVGILKSMIEKAMSDPLVDSIVVPMGSGELICRKK
ncbi:methyltransferase [candidate division TA06 bacterium DG_26]|uniref:Methyltransferase n=1 Tax=candidate division TA06 bacterium DG_26 TaxID=1703771 RepID=A0A0S7WMS6_UNCT6|nr:MAG: methyltransferase [candidate division TA06 bacterium DG_26]